MVKRTSNSSYIALSILLSSTLLAFLFLTSIPTSALDNVVDDVHLSIQVSCTLSSTLDSAHADHISNGTYKADIGITTLKVICNDNEGFAIYAAGYTGEVIGGTDSTKLVGTNGSIVTGLATSGNTSNWAMKLATNSSATYPITLDSDTNGSFGAYHVVPSSYTKVAHRDGITDIGLNAVGATLTTTYRAYAAPEQPAGTYAGKVIYSLVHPADEGAPMIPQPSTAGYISYYPNANGVADRMGDQSVDSSATEVDLWASNFQRQGYGFAGWSTTHDYSDPNGFLGPNETIEDSTTLAKIQSEGLSLYAYWIKTAGNLQGWTGCNTMNIGDVTALTDQRDDNTYAIAKLADGKCWMIENLRLDYTNSDNSTGALSQGYGGQFVGLALPETANFNGSASSNTDPTEANSLYYAGSGNEGSLGATIDISQTNYAGFRMPRYRNDNTNTNSSINPNTNTTNMTEANQNVYGYGNYYSWPAAKANTSYLNSIAKTNAASTSLCPSGWRLPRGGNKANQSNNEFWSLVVIGINGGTNPANYDNSTQPYYTGSAEAGPVNKLIRKFPNNFVYNGLANGSFVSNRGSFGGYWSSSSNNATGSYNLYFNSTNVNPGTLDYHYKYDGSAIRCVISPSA